MPNPNQESHLKVLRHLISTRGGQEPDVLQAFEIHVLGPHHGVEFPRPGTRRSRQMNRLHSQAVFFTFKVGLDAFGKTAHLLHRLQWNQFDTAFVNHHMDFLPRVNIHGFADFLGNNHRYQIVSTIAASLRFWSAVMTGALRRMEVAAINRSAGSLPISAARLTDSSAISGVISCR